MHEIKKVDWGTLSSIIRKKIFVYLKPYEVIQLSLVNRHWQGQILKTKNKYELIPKDISFMIFVFLLPEEVAKTSFLNHRWRYRVENNLFWKHALSQYYFYNHHKLDEKMFFNGKKLFAYNYENELLRMKLNLPSTDLKLIRKKLYYIKSANFVVDQKAQSSLLPYMITTEDFKVIQKIYFDSFLRIECRKKTVCSWDTAINKFVIPGYNFLHYIISHSPYKQNIIEKLSGIEILNKNVPDIDFKYSNSKTVIKIDDDSMFYDDEVKNLSFKSVLQQVAQGEINIETLKSSLISWKKILYTAICHCHLDIVQYVLENNDITTNIATMALIIAIYNGHILAVQYLLDFFHRKKIDIKMKEVVIKIISLDNYCYINIIKLLFQQNQLFNEDNIKGILLASSFDTPMCHILLLKQKQLFKSILAYENFAKQNSLLFNLLTLGQQLNISQELNAFDINLDKLKQRDEKDGQTIIHRIVQSQSIIGLKRLIALKGNVNLHDEKGRSPLHYALCPLTDHFVNLEIINCLLEYKADVNAFDYRHQTPLHYFAVNKEQILRDEDYYKILNKLLAYKENLHMHDDQGYTPLVLALITGNLKVANALIWMGNFYFDIRSKFKGGANLLHLLAEHDCGNSIELLNQRGLIASLKKERNNSGKTPIDIANEHKKLAAKFALTVPTILPSMLNIILYEKNKFFFPGAQDNMYKIIKELKIYIIFTNDWPANQLTTNLMFVKLKIQDIGDFCSLPDNVGELKRALYNAIKLGKVDFNEFRILLGQSVNEAEHWTFRCDNSLVETEQLLILALLEYLQSNRESKSLIDKIKPKTRNLDYEMYCFRLKRARLLDRFAEIAQQWVKKNYIHFFRKLLDDIKLIHSLLLEIRDFQTPNLFAATKPQQQITVSKIFADFLKSALLEQVADETIFSSHLLELKKCNFYKSYERYKKQDRFKLLFAIVPHTPMVAREEKIHIAEMYDEKKHKFSQPPKQIDETYDSKKLEVSSPDSSLSSSSTHKDATQSERKPEIDEKKENNRIDISTGKLETKRNNSNPKNLRVIATPSPSKTIKLHPIGINAYSYQRNYLQLKARKRVKCYVQNKYQQILATLPKNSIVDYRSNEQQINLDHVIHQKIEYYFQPIIEHEYWNCRGKIDLFGWHCLHACPNGIDEMRTLIKARNDQKESSTFTRSFYHVVRDRLHKPISNMGRDNNVRLLYIIIFELYHCLKESTDVNQPYNIRAVTKMIEMVARNMAEKFNIKLPYMNESNKNKILS